MKTLQKFLTFQPQNLIPHVDCKVPALNLVFIPADSDIEMNRGIYTAATGLQATQRWMDLTANNLANASTQGFKQDMLNFGDSLVKELAKDGGSGQPIGSIGFGPDQVDESTDFSAGGMIQTGNKLDFALMDEKQMFAIQRDGQTLYTRNGSFRLNDTNQLVTQQGDFVLDDRLQPINLPVGTSLQPDGTVSDGTRTTQALGVFRGEFQKVGDVLFQSSNPQPVTEARVEQGMLESSNVNAVKAMIDLIKINRHFEMAQKSIQSQDDMTQRLIQSLQK